MVHKKKKKEREEVKKKRPLPLFDWQIYPKWNVQLLNVAPWPNDEPCCCPGPPTSAWFEASTVLIAVETASTMAVSHTSSSSSTGSSSCKERTGASMPGWSASVQRGPRPFVCDTVARNTFIASTGRPWSAWSQPSPLRGSGCDLPITTSVSAMNL